MSKMDSRFRLFVYILVADIVLGTIGFMSFEKLSLIDSFYFTVVTITTVGYGDIAPYTAMGRAIAGLLIITGVGAFTGVVATITESLVIGKEEEFRNEKLSMVLSVFYSEFGNDLLLRLVESDPQSDMIRSALLVEKDWDHERFAATRKVIDTLEFRIDAREVDLSALRDFIDERTETLLRMLENPNLHRDSSLTDLIRAILHFKEELFYREDFSILPDTDFHHLSGDASRVYRMLTLHWIDYLVYIKDNYPYLYSLALRVNPYRKDRSAIVMD